MSAPEIRVVTEEEEAARTYSIFDVVLPVIDSSVLCVLPRNSVGRFVNTYIYIYIYTYFTNHVFYGPFVLHHVILTNIYVYIYIHIYR